MLSWKEFNWIIFSTKNRCKWKNIKTYLRATWSGDVECVRLAQSVVLRYCEHGYASSNHITAVPTHAAFLTNVSVAWSHFARQRKLFLWNITPYSVNILEQVAAFIFAVVQVVCAWTHLKTASASCTEMLVPTQRVSSTLGQISKVSSPHQNK